MSFLTLEKIFVLDENYPFPRCHSCDNETTPVALTMDDVAQLISVFTSQYAQRYLRETEDGDIVLFICRHCCQVEDV